MSAFFTKVLSHLQGPKFAGLMVIVLALLLAGWTIAPDKLSAVTIAIAASYTTFAASHSYTDAKANRTNTGGK
jgi:hypothetical protein